MTPSSDWRRLHAYLRSPAHTPNLLFVLAGGYALVLFGWELRHAAALASVVWDNSLPSGDYPSLLGFAAGSALAFICWVLLSLGIARASHSRLDAVLDKVSALFLAASLLAFLPVLAIAGAEARPAFTLGLIGVMGALAGVAAWAYRRPDGAAGRWADLSPRLGALLAGLTIAGYVAFMAVFTVARHNSFLTHSFDLGIHDQAIYSLVARGVPIVTQYGAEPVNQFGDHFAPIFYLIAPLYAPFRDARLLLILQSAALGMGGVAVYLLARAKTGHVALALALTISYLLFPALHAVNVFDFHEIALATPLLLFSLYFLETDRRGLFVAFLALALLTKEEVALSGAAIGLYVLFVKRQARLGALVAAGSLAYFALVNFAIMPALGGGPDLGRFAGLAQPGEIGFAGLLQGLAANPFYASSQVFLNGQKMIFLVQLLLPVLFLPLLAGAAWLMAVPAFAVALLASVPSQYSLLYHYPAIIVPFVFVLAVLGLERLGRRPTSNASGVAYDPIALAAAMLVVSLAMNYAYGWVFGKRFVGFPQPSRHLLVTQRLADSISPEASLSTLSDIVPHVSSRDEIYLFPIVGEAEFVLFDADPAANFWPFTSLDARAESTAALAPLLLSGRYGLVQAEEGVLLLQKGADPARNHEALAALFANRYEAEDLKTALGAQTTADPDAQNGAARVARPEMAIAGDQAALTYGPYASLPGGAYEIAYRLKLDGSTGPGAVATVDVFSSAAGGALASRELQKSDFDAAGQYQEVTLDLETQKRYGDLEFRVLYNGVGTLAADSIRVTPRKVWVPVLDIQPPEMPAADNAADRGLLAATDPTALLPGTYRAVFTLSSARAGDGAAAGRIEVLSPTAGGPLAEWTLTTSDFAAPGQPQPLSLDFRIDQPWPDVSLRAVDTAGDAITVDRVELFFLFENGNHGQS